MIREQTVCFSGHRPEKLPGMRDGREQALLVIKSMLYYQIRKAVADGYTDFISGLARGVDLWAAGYVLELRRENPALRLYCVKPTASHGNNFRGSDRYALDSVLERADGLFCTAEAYSKDCYRIRNQYMVDHAARLIAVVDDYRSGTGQTISYARKTGLELCVIEVGEILKQAESLPTSFIIPPCP